VPAARRTRAAYRTVLRQRPRSGFALYGIARTFEAQNDRGKTARAYRAFLDAWPDANQALPQVTAARQWLAHHAPGDR